MSNDWDVIEELEFWDDYHAIYGPEPISRRKQKKINKYNKRKAKEAARKQKEAEDRLAEKVAAKVNEQNAKEKNTNQTAGVDDAGVGCAAVVVVVIIIALIWFFA